MKLQIYCKNCKTNELHKKSDKIFECESCSNKFQVYCPECFYDDYKLILFSGGNIYRCINCKHTFREIISIIKLRELKIEKILNGS
jgi:ribosomal protein L37AE/L43A